MVGLAVIEGRGEGGEYNKGLRTTDLNVCPELHVLTSLIVRDKVSYVDKMIVGR